MAHDDRIEAAHTYVVYDGPTYVDPLDGRAGTFVQACAELSDAELVELCHYWEVQGDQAEEEIDRWWCWTVVRFGRRLLTKRTEVRRRQRQWF